MFDTYAIDNDLKYVDTKIRNYYEVGDFIADSEIEKMDAEKAAPEVVKPDTDGRRRRRKKEDEEEKHIEEKPEQTQTENAEEAPTEKPKRRRKDRSGDSNDNGGRTADTESDNAESGRGDNNTVTDNETQKPKRRRKKRDVENTASDLPDSFEEQEQDIPF